MRTILQGEPEAASVSVYPDTWTILVWLGLLAIGYFLFILKIWSQH